MRVAALLLLLASLAAPGAAWSQGAPAKTVSPQAAFDQSVAAAKQAMMAEPGKALAKADVAIARARDLGNTPHGETAMATAEWLKGEAYIYLNQPDAAVPLVNAALARVMRVAPNTKLHGDLLRSRGAIAAIGGRNQAALTDFQAAFAAFRKAGEARSQAIALQDIGQIYWDAGDYARTLDYYLQAGELYSADPNFALTSHNNRGEVLRKLGRHSEAEREYSLALKAARSLGSPLLEVRILSNLAAAQVENRKLAQAENTIEEALRLSRSGEAAGWRPFVLGAAAKVAAARGELTRAADLLTRTFSGADLDKTPLPFVEFHQIASDVYDKLGQKELAYRHLKAFQRLDSEAQKLTASASSQLLAAQFDSANQKFRISELKQGQLERDIRIERQQSELRTTIFGGLIGAGAIILALLAISMFRIRRSRNQVRAANTVLTQVNDKLEKALQAKTEFLATTSHEIRTPLNGILGMTQILLTNRRIDAEVREQINLVHGAGETMRALVDDILDVAKMETGEIEVTHEETQLRQILEEAARLWNGHAAAKGVSMHVDVANAPSRIFSDGARIRQIIFNLLSNAVKFTPSGSIDLVARADDEARVLVIEVRDTGIGIPAAHHERVFEAFHQVDGGTNRQFSGTGLGLAICRKLTGALGGSIALQSTPGSGSCFTVRLPLEIATGAIEPMSPGVRPASLRQARLLLVDANAIRQGVVGSLLEPVVGSFASADDASAACAAMRAGTVDHLLIEAQSTVGDEPAPIEALREIIDAAQSANIAVSILLASSDALPIGDVALLGATQLILKPVGGAQLVATLQSAYPYEPRSNAQSAAA